MTSEINQCEKCKSKLVLVFGSDTYFCNNKKCEYFELFPKGIQKLKQQPKEGEKCPNQEQHEDPRFPDKCSLCAPSNEGSGMEWGAERYQSLFDELSALGLANKDLPVHFYEALDFVANFCGDKAMNREVTFYPVDQEFEQLLAYNTKQVLEDVYKLRFTEISNRPNFRYPSVQANEILEYARSKGITLDNK